jgi:bifunctional enzyme CysN/CysC
MKDSPLIRVPDLSGSLDQAARAQLMRQAPCVLWFTGLSGAGKSTIAQLVEKDLHARGLHTYLLDGDNLRCGLNRDLGYGTEDRRENVRRVTEVARLMADAGLMVIVALISPFRAERRLARESLQPCRFFEVFVDTPLSVAEGRDPKGLYAKARRGQIKDFTGIDSPYEQPECPDIHLNTTRLTAEQAAGSVLANLEHAGMLDTVECSIASEPLRAVGA